MLRRFLANRGYISNFRVVFFPIRVLNNTCIMSSCSDGVNGGGQRWWQNTGPKMLARNCKRCMVRFYLIFVRYWMGICGHTFTTSDQDSCVSINHTVPVFSPLWCMFATCFYCDVIPACLCFTYLVRELSCRWKYCLYIWIFSFVFFSKIRLCSHRY